MKYLMDRDIIGKRIRMARIMRNTTMKKLAYECGITSETIGCVERGKNYPSLFTILAICNVLDIDIRTLVSNNKIRLDGMKWAE